jgi:Raf kinase inhibitor-like YbhB/YbcL family protein
MRRAAKSCAIAAKANYADRRRRMALVKDTENARAHFDVAQCDAIVREHNAGLQSAAATSIGVTMALRLVSSAFAANGDIPAQYTCEGRDASPPLTWSGVPANTKSLALIVDDPDAPDPAAPKMTWVHWVLYNLPTSTVALPEGLSSAVLPPGTREGLNDWKRTGYGGPCPPIGRHRYFHKLYALDVVLPDLQRPTKGQLERAMQGHILAKAELIGTYKKRA